MWKFLSKSIIPSKEENKNREIASFHRRMLAANIDALLLALVITPIVNFISYLIYGMTSDEVIRGFATSAPEAQGDPIGLFNYLRNGFEIKFIVIQFMVFFMICAIVLTFWIMRDATIGKMITRCKIVDAKTGGKPTPKQYLLRLFGYILSCIPPFIGFFMIGMTKNKRGLHDYIAGTKVIRTGV